MCLSRWTRCHAESRREGNSLCFRNRPGQPWKPPGCQSHLATNRAATFSSACSQVPSSHWPLSLTGTPLLHQLSLLHRKKVLSSRQTEQQANSAAYNTHILAIYDIDAICDTKQSLALGRALFHGSDWNPKVPRYLGSRLHTYIHTYPVCIVLAPLSSPALPSKSTSPFCRSCPHCPLAIASILFCHSMSPSHAYCEASLFLTNNYSGSRLLDVGENTFLSMLKPPYESIEYILLRASYNIRSEALSCYNEILLITLSLTRTRLAIRNASYKTS